jgi:tetrahydromethanopterin S-methyltransferase subunit F
VLYNNGFAAGLVASVLLPVILALRASTDNNENR